MYKFWLLVLGLSSLAIAQSTTVSGTLVDQQSIVWSNAKISITFTPSTYPPPYTWSGGSYAPTASAITDASGHFSIVLPSNTSITPAGSTWQFIIAPNSSIAPVIFNISVTGTTQSVNTIFTQNAIPAYVQSMAVPRTYGSATMVSPPNVGQLAYDTTNKNYIYWENSTWNALTGGGGGPCTPNCVTSFSAPPGSWPSWLVPTVTNSTTTPSLAVAASTIPNSALTNNSTTVQGQSCVLGGSCTVFTGQTNSTNMSSQTGVNLVNSTANAIGLVSSVSNPATNQARIEITGVLTTAAGGTGTNTGLTVLNASNLTSGTVNNARLNQMTNSAQGIGQCDGTTITCVSGVISANPTIIEILNAGTITGSTLAAGASESTGNITVTGALQGSPVIWSATDGSQQLAGIRTEAQCPSANTCTVVRTNQTGSSIVTTTKTYNITVTQ
jgi:hypothetical protein